MKRKIDLLFIFVFASIAFFSVAFANDGITMSTKFLEESFKEKYESGDSFAINIMIDNACSDFGCLTGFLEFNSSIIKVSNINSEGIVVDGIIKQQTIYPKYINTISNDNSNQIFFWIEDEKNRLKDGCIARVIFNVKEACSYKDMNFTYKKVQASDYSISKIYEFRQLNDNSTISGDVEEKEDDFTSSNWAKEELKRAKINKLIPESLSNADFTKPVTRKDFAAIAVKLYETISSEKVIKPEVNPFKDTDDSYVLKAYALEITYGTRVDQFSPDAEITREQLATMLTRAIQKAGIDTNINLDNISLFTDDSSLKKWSREAVYFMYSSEIINGIGKNYFGVTNNATIEQAVAISNRWLIDFGAKNRMLN